MNAFESVLIGGTWRASQDARASFRAFDPTSGEEIGPQFPLSGAADIEAALAAASEAAIALAACAPERIAGFLDAYAAAIEADAETLVNLASEEYFKSVKPKLLDVPVITPQFEDWKNGKYKIISFFAKRARGMMARYAAEQAITDVARLKAFDVDGYAFDEAVSTDREWVFRRRVEG